MKPFQTEFRGTRRSLLRGVAVAGVLGVSSRALAACSSESSSGSGSGKAAPDEVKAALEAARAVPTFKAPGPAIDATSLSGKKAFYIGGVLSIPVIREFADGFKSAGDVVGLDVTIYDGKGDPSTVAAGVTQAIAQGADVLVIDSFPSASLSAPISQAKDAGLKVVASDFDLAGEDPDAGGPAPGVDALANCDFLGAGKLEAEWVVADAAGKGINCVVFKFPGSPLMDRWVDGIKEVFTQYSPGFKLSVQEVAQTDYASRLATLVSSLVAQDRSINYMIPLVDAACLYIVPALHTANMADKVRISTFNGTPAVLKMLEKQDVVAADVGSPPRWQGWGIMDQTLRVLLDTTPVDPLTSPLRLLDATNIDSIDISGDDAEWYDTAAAEAEYRKLWGLA